MHGNSFEQLLINNARTLQSDPIGNAKYLWYTHPHPRPQSRFQWIRLLPKRLLRVIYHLSAPWVLAMLFPVFTVGLVTCSLLAIAVEAVFRLVVFKYSDHAISSRGIVPKFGESLGFTGELDLIGGLFFLLASDYGQLNAFFAPLGDNYTLLNWIGFLLDNVFIVATASIYEVLEWRFS